MLYWKTRNAKISLDEASAGTGNYGGGGGVSNATFESYQMDVEATFEKYIKCEQADELVIYLSGEIPPSLTDRDDRKLYMVTTDNNNWGEVKLIFPKAITAPQA